MLTFKLTIDCENAALFDEEADGINLAELARIIKSVADKVESGHASGKAKDVWDVNGNTVGQFWIEHV